MMKRTFDVFMALVALMLLFPVLAIVAILVKLDSQGPILFKQTRFGLGFRPFTLLKFRTMVQGAEKQGGPLTVGADSRITRVGAVLRQLKLDELLQLWNIVKGDMSFVGPRPEVPHYVEMFREDYREVLTVRPGLTDLASLKYLDEQSILAGSDNPEKEYVEHILPDKVRLAKSYVSQSSFFYDLFLIGETLLRLVGIKKVFDTLTGESEKPADVNGHSATLSQNGFVTKWRRPIVVLIHVALIIAANYGAFWLKFDGMIPEHHIHLFQTMLPFLLVVRTLTFIPFRLYQGLWKYTSLWDLRNIIGATAVSSLAFYLLVTIGFGRFDYPLSVMLIDSLLLLVMLGGIRLTRRIFRGILKGGRGKRVLVIGAGDAGEMIIRDMLRRPETEYSPIGLVDDDQRKIGQRIHGIPVVGSSQNLTNLMEQYHPEEVLLAIPRADSSVRRQIVQAIEGWNVPIKTLPSVQELLECKVGVTQIRPLAIEDLLGRDPVPMKSEFVRELIHGKRVMVTGAGGSIGSELCRQIISLNPQELVLYERYENSLHSIQTELLNLVGAPPIYAVVGDVTDRNRLDEIMEKHRPELLFHAAAHKHVPLMELNAGEAIKNNVLGTQAVAKAADRFGVQRFVLISTDKAVNPTSVMGATKRVAELVIQHIAQQSKTCFTVVRFGNVLGSNGSVVPAFKAQIQSGGPVTVTHPEMRRYFMLIPEAVHLVLQAATLGEQGTIYVLEMGEQVKVLDLARNLIRLSGFIPEVEIPITFVGLRDGEKLYEELVGEGERIQASSVEKIYRVQNGKYLNTSDLFKKILEFERITTLKQPFCATTWLQELVPTFHPPNHIPNRFVASSSVAEKVGSAR